MRLKKQICVNGLGLVFVLATGIIFAGPYDAQMQKACPDAWQNTKAVMPVPSVHYKLSEYVNPPWNKDNPSADKANVTTVLGATGSLPKTIDPATISDLVDDPLTVASECLKHRNYTVDTMDYTGPPDVPLNPEAGWLPAIF